MHVCIRLKIIYLSSLGSLPLCRREVTDTDFNMKLSADCVSYRSGIWGFQFRSCG